MKKKKLLITFMFFSYLLILTLIILSPTFNILTKHVYGILLFFIFFGITIGLWEYLDKNNKRDKKIKKLQSKELTIKIKNNKIRKNNRYRLKKKHRKRYYREHVGKQFRKRKALINRKKYSEKIADKYWKVDEMVY